jgi:CspA family cold shock protein
VTAGARLTGTVVAFDEAAGLGEIVGGAPAPKRYRFHCTQIADGSRQLAIGTVVSFSVLAGRGGSWEAADVRPVGGGS